MLSLFKKKPKWTPEKLKSLLGDQFGEPITNDSGVLLVTSDGDGVAYIKVTGVAPEIAFTPDCCPAVAGSLVKFLMGHTPVNIADHYVAITHISTPKDNLH